MFDLRQRFVLNNTKLEVFKFNHKLIIYNAGRYSNLVYIFFSDRDIPWLILFSSTTTMCFCYLTFRMCDLYGYFMVKNSKFLYRYYERANEMYDCTIHLWTI